MSVQGRGERWHVLRWISGIIAGAHRWEGPLERYIYMIPDSMCDFSALRRKQHNAFFNSKVS